MSPKVALRVISRARNNQVAFREIADIGWQPGLGHSVAIDPTVWTGRALQAESAEWQQLVLRFCIRPLVEQIAPGHHGYPRASDLILG